MIEAFVDLTAFFAFPGRTGIQRVSGELCRFWPDSRSLTPVKLTSNRRLVVLPKTALQLIRAYFDAPASCVAGLEQQLANLSKQAESFEEVLDLGRDCRVLVPELFYDPCRVSFFGSLPPDYFSRFYFVVYDLLPFIHPEFFRANPPQEVINGYVRIVRTAPHVAFISKCTREAYYRRLLRSSPYNSPVLQLGSDSLGSRPTGQHSRSTTPKFTVLGTIEPRKNHALILDVFEPLMREIEGLRLVFLGHIGWVDSPLVSRVQRMSGGDCSGFQHIASPSDELIRQHVLQSWATIYISEAEGFGLPPVESLWLGTPVIASATVPSLEAIEGGTHIVEPLNALNLRAAVLAFLDDLSADRKRNEAMNLSLPTWRGFALQVAEWCMQ